MSLWRTKPIPSPDSPPDSSAGAPSGVGLQRVFGVWQLITLGVGATIGAGLFSVTGIAAGQNAGPAVTLSFIISAIACGFAGLCYAELAGMITVAGSAYSYAYAAMGELVAWFIGWDLVLEYTVNAATVASSWSGYFISLFDGRNIGLDPRLLAPPMTPVTMPDGTMAHAWLNLPSMFILWGVTGLLMYGMGKSSRINAALVILKLLIVACVILVCLPHIHTANFHPYIPPNQGAFGQFGTSGIIQAAGLVFFAYVGFDIVSTAAQDSHDPQRNIPIGILGTLASCAVIYVLFSFVLVGVVNYRNMGSNANPVATAMDTLHMPWLSEIIKLGITIGYVPVIYGLLMGQSRIAITIAEDGLLPAFFARLHTRRRTPWGSHLLTAVISSLLAACLPISVLGKMTSIGTLLAFVIVCAGVLVLRFKASDLPRRFRVPGGAFLVPLLGIISCGGVMLSMDNMTWLRLILWLLVGGLVYALYGFGHSRLSSNRTQQKR